ncbi:FAD-dependent oxidoreductase [Streptomyces sp. MS1.HAVA.3]|uniref:FAD-dependent oxidoreductase n=1 Tax=Streptomyces caledonius TaxID=3134107 RepID=A0ABU8U316_9ACTN
MRSVAKSLSEAKPVSYWLDDPGKPAPRPALTSDERCDLLVIGAGYSGLWTALIAKERDPERDVVLIESKEAGWAASGRNGGFCAASLTHGLGNGLARWPGELAKLEELGVRNLDAIEEAVARYGIDCDFERTGEIDVATEPHQVEELRELHEEARRLGLADGSEWLDRDAVRAEVDSPTFLAGLWDRDGVAMLNPAKLAWGLKQACLDLGVRIYENTRGLKMAPAGPGMTVQTPYGTILARRVALGTNIFPSLVKRIRPFTVPVYDYALMSEPLDEAQLAAIGWKNRQGLGTAPTSSTTSGSPATTGSCGAATTRSTPTGKLDSEYDHRPETYLRLAEHFFTAFPQLEGLRFSHAWGGAIDTCSRFSAFFGTAHSGKVAYAAGYTGLGVGATRFGAEVMLDLLDGLSTERTRLEMVKSKPMPFPPEPFAWTGIALTKWSLARADARGGHRNLWLKVMDKLGLGFDS